MLTQKDLNSIVCQRPGCKCGGELYMHSSCHPASPTWCMYHPDGFLRITCAECDKMITEIKVQDDPKYLLAALHLAIDTIRTWHGMGISKEDEEKLWGIYQNSPEMRKINEAVRRGE